MYDTSTANPVNPQGTAGGGNQIIAAPIFGNNSVTNPTGGPGSASTNSSDTAALGGPAVGGNAGSSPVAAVASAAQSGLNTLLSSPLLMLTVFGVVVLLMGALVFTHFKRK